MSIVIGKSLLIQLRVVHLWMQTKVPGINVWVKSLTLEEPWNGYDKNFRFDHHFKIPTNICCLLGCVFVQLI
jgi:hypothetical protein